MKTPHTLSIGEGAIQVLQGVEDKDAYADRLLRMRKQHVQDALEIVSDYMSQFEAQVIGWIVIESFGPEFPRPTADIRGAIVHVLTEAAGRATNDNRKEIPAERWPELIEAVKTPGVCGAIRVITEELLLRDHATAQLFPPSAPNS